MYLSQLMVNPGSHPDMPRPGLDWIKQTYSVHQRIWMAFPGTQRMTDDPFFLGQWSSDSLSKPRRKDGGFLFRVEPDRPLRILVQSFDEPCWDYAFRNASHLLTGEPQVRSFDPSPSLNARYRFRLVMQMVRRRTIPAAEIKEGQKARSEHPIRCLLPPREGVVGREVDPQFTAWREKLMALGQRHGFTVGEPPAHLRVSPVSNLYMKPEGRQRPRRFNAALFEGVLTCTDPAAMREAIVNGIGRGKAFGMGLLSLATVR